MMTRLWITNELSKGPGEKEKEKEIGRDWSCEQKWD